MALKKTAKENVVATIKKYTTEFTMIFISVILAFALTEWSANRGEKISETKILSEIKNGITSDCEDFESNLKMHKISKAAVHALRRWCLNQPSLQKDLQTTLSNLKKIDTSKFDLCIDHPDNSIPFDHWKNNLQTEKTVNVVFQNSISNSKKMGTVILLTKKGDDHYKQAYYKQQADKQRFVELIARYRRHESTLPDKLIYIDNYHFQTQWIMDSLNTDIIQFANITEPESVKDLFQDDRKKGYIQLYTRNFSPNQDELFKKQLREILNDYKDLKIPKDQYLIFVNNRTADLEELVEIDLNSNLQIHILNLQTAKDLFGSTQNRSIIYLNWKEN